MREHIGPQMTNPIEKVEVPTVTSGNPNIRPSKKTPIPWKMFSIILGKPV